MRRTNLILLVALAMGLATTLADGVSENRQPAYEYTAEEVRVAAETDLDSLLEPFRLAGKLNRSTQDFERVQHLFAQVVDVAKQRSDLAQKLDWAIYLHEGRFVEAYSRAGGKIIISAKFLERYRPNDAELAFVIGHEIAHVLCEHERMNLSAVWRRNAPQNLQARYAMEFLDTEPLVRAQVAPMARLQERVADRIGLELATATGIEPSGALRFFDKSAEDDEGGVFADVHDRPAQRKALLSAATTSLQMLAAVFRSREIDCKPDATSAP
jgi:Zn-dependent protease with chaperone function